MNQGSRKGPQSYATPMELLWNFYGIPLVHQALFARAARGQQASHTPRGVSRLPTSRRPAKDLDQRVLSLRRCGQDQVFRPAPSKAHFSFARIISSQVTSTPL